jgi:hypothetical protein
MVNCCAGNVVLQHVSRPQHATGKCNAVGCVFFLPSWLCVIWCFISVSAKLGDVGALFQTLSMACQANPSRQSLQRHSTSLKTAGQPGVTGSLCVTG